MAPRFQHPLYQDGNMSAKIIDGAAIAREIIAAQKARVEMLMARGVTPGLAAVQVGDDPASKVYIRNKMRACSDAGLHSVVRQLPASASEAEVLATVSDLNADASVHGIIVQLPLPGGMDADRVVQTVALAKDVDGFNMRHLGGLLTGHPGAVPCTPCGAMHLISSTGLDLDGRNAVVIGRSAIVGKPMALLLMERGATVTICHSRTKDVGAHTRNADILVVAAGRPRLVTGDMVKAGAVVIDVGINRLEDGKLAGDVDFAGVSQVAGWITPVPGGVGPMTVAMLIRNTVDAAERALESGAV